MEINVDSLLETILTFINADSWNESRHIVENHPELLNETTDAVLQQLVAAQDDDRAKAVIEEHRQLLERCRAAGTEAAFAEKTEGRGGDVRAELQAIFRELSEPARLSEMPRRIQLIQQALRLVSRDQNPLLWAALQVELGNTLAQNPLNDRAANLEQAIASYEQALEVRTREAMPVEWAQTMNNLANAYRNRIRGERAANLEQAIASYEQALEVRTREAMPVEWATTMMNLANAYQSRIRGERAANLEQAIESYQQALEVTTREALPVDWAQTMMNLALAYAERIRGERAANLEQAIGYYEQALAVMTREALPVEWATTMMNLANAYADRIRGERAANLGQAIGCYEQALEELTVDHFPDYHRRTQRNLGDLYFPESDWAQAHSAYTGAIEAGAALLAEAYTETGRQAEVAETAELYARDAYCLLNMAQPRDALLRLEQGKARLLAEALALGDADLEQLPEKQRAAMLTVRQSVRELEAELRLPPDTPGRRDEQALTEMLRQARANLNERIKAICAERPDFMPEGLDLPDLLTLIPPAGALVAPLLTSKGSAVFVVPHGAETVSAEHVVPVEDFTDGDLRALLRGPADDPQLGGWLGAYSKFRTDLAGWFNAIESSAQALWKKLLEPVKERLENLGLKEGAPIILMPQGGLGLLPLHAAWREVDGTKRSLLDDYTVTYVPSGYALDIGRRRLADPRRQVSSLLAVVNPTKDLAFTPVEGETVEALFDPDARQSLLGEKAIVETVKQAAHGRSYLHFSCHGFYHWGNPMQSGLVMAGGTPLTLAEIISTLDLSTCRLVTLSACETGITDIGRSPDEFLGLPAGFLQAGAPGVVSTLWAVNDLSTMLLMERFYKNHLQRDLHPAAALREAQLWLRDVTADELYERFDAEGEALIERFRMSGEFVSDQVDRFAAQKPSARPFSHPYYWAAFTFSGV